MAGCDTLHLQVFCGVTCQLEDFGSEVLQDGGKVDSCFGADARLVAGNGSEVALYATAWELGNDLLVFARDTDVIVLDAS